MKKEYDIKAYIPDRGGIRTYLDRAIFDGWDIQYHEDKRILYSLFYVKGYHKMSVLQHLYNECEKQGRNK